METGVELFPVLKRMYKQTAESFSDSIPWTKLYAAKSKTKFMIFFYFWLRFGDVSQTIGRIILWIVRSRWSRATPGDPRGRVYLGVYPSKKTKSPTIPRGWNQAFNFKILQNLVGEVDARLSQNSRSGWGTEVSVSVCTEVSVSVCKCL